MVLAPFKDKTFEQWQSYPIYLKETLFYFGENYDKYRKMEIGYKFFVSDDLKEQANIHCNKGEYQ